MKPGRKAGVTSCRVSWAKKKEFHWQPLNAKVLRAQDGESGEWISA